MKNEKLDKEIKETIKIMYKSKNYTKKQDYYIIC